MIGKFDSDRFMRPIHYDLPIRTFVANWTRGNRWLIKQQIQLIQSLLISFLLYAMLIIFVLVFQPELKITLVIVGIGCTHLMFFGYAEMKDIVAIGFAFGRLWFRLIVRLIMYVFKMISVAAFFVICLSMFF